MARATVHDLKTLILSFQPVVAIDSVEEERVESLVREVAAELRLPLFQWSITQGFVRDGANRHPTFGTTDALGALRHIETLSVEAIFHMRDLAVHLSRPDVQRAFLDAATKFSKTRSTIVLSGVPAEVPPAVATMVVHLELQLPSPDELRLLVGSVAAAMKASGRPVTVTLEPPELDALVLAMRGLTLNQARQALAYAALTDRRLSAEDIGRILERKAQIIQDGGLLEYYPASDNAFQIGGFERFREWLARSRVGFESEARALNLRPPRGVLVVGVQGCGKSLAAKVIAREWRMPLLKLDAARLLDKFVGESEKNLRRALDMAESMAPAVLWIDEIEKGFATGSVEADGGLARRLLGSFLTWLQEHRTPVFVAATANDLSALPPELMRKGRFDEIFFVDLPDPRTREAILRIHLSLRHQDPARFDLPALAAASEGFSGAELEQALVAALYRTLYEKRPLDTSLLLSMLRATVPLSVSRREDIAALRAYAAGRFVPVK
ncbi:MAG TPA: AAA family ATPase [Vicinamibacterales bacterium]|nr:AAA family ATPase [Vicinamibacterales bacterium]